MPVLLPLRSQPKGRVLRVVLLRSLTLFVSSAGCRVPRSSVPSVTPSHLPETFGASTYEGPSGRAGPSYSAQLITPRGRRTTATTKKKKDVLKCKEKKKTQTRDSRHGLEDTGAAGSLGSQVPHVETSFSICSGQNQTLCCEAPFFKNQYSPSTRSLELALHRGWLVSPPLDCVVDHSAPRRLGKGPLTERC